MKNTKTKKQKEETLPEIFPGDHPLVVQLVQEARRCNQKGREYSSRNPIAADAYFRCGWAHALSAAHLRCFIKGELTVKPTENK